MLLCIFLKPMQFTVLGSGSSGNAVLISTGKTRVLVDAGLSAKELLRRITEVGENFENLDGVLITHEHGDHAGGLRVLMKHLKCPVFISGETQNAYFATRKGNDESQKRRDALKNKTVEIESSKDFQIGDIDFHPFSLPHDAVDNFGFVAERAGVKIATLWDFGHVTTLIKEKLMGCDGIVIEANHSIDMLKTCPLYSWDLKQRIASRMGHLSNEDLAEWLTNDYDGSAHHIMLAHLSQQTNEPHLARLTAQTALNLRKNKCDTKISLTHSKIPTDWIKF
jgi:phosphoribosyl 1,2-cyclic phosphodiesterase